jgi:hypothetical protein
MRELILTFCLKNSYIFIAVNNDLLCFSPDYIVAAILSVADRGVGIYVRLTILFARPLLFRTHVGD